MEKLTTPIDYIQSLLLTINAEQFYNLYDDNAIIKITTQGTFNGDEFYDRQNKTKPELIEWLDACHFRNIEFIKLHYLEIIFDATGKIHIHVKSNQKKIRQRSISTGFIEDRIMLNVNESGKITQSVHNTFIDSIKEECEEDLVKCHLNQPIQSESISKILEYIKTRYIVQKKGIGMPISLKVSGSDNRITYNMIFHNQSNVQVDISELIIKDDDILLESYDRFMTNS
jgi:hypothetical protein